MSKILKLIFNRVFIALFLFALQVALIIFVLQDAAEYYWILNVFFGIVNIIYAFKLLKKDISPTFKFPIVFILILFPFIGVFLYYFSFENRMRKKLVKNVKNQTFTLESLYIEDPKIRKQLLAKDKNIYRQSQYIANNTFLPVYTNTETKYFEIGETFFDSLIKDLKNSRDFIFLEYFIIGNGILWNSILDILKQKVKQGVEVRVIFDDIGSFKTLPYRYNKILEKFGIKCVVFNPILPTLSLVHNNRDHKKIAIIDGKITYTGGINIADEYINKKTRFGHWKDTGIKIVGEASKSFTLIFLETWHYFRDSSEDCSIYLNTSPIVNNDLQEGYVQPYIGDPMSDSAISREVYINIINTAEDYIYITSPYLAIDQEFLLSLTNASKRGVDVKLITPHIPDKAYIFRVTQSYYKTLIDHGINVYEYAPGFIHSKLIISDDKLATIGTVNFDYRSFYHNYECGVWLYNTNSIKDIKKDFENTLKKSVQVTDEFIKTNINWFKHLSGEFLKLFAPLF